jgi:hypothetical protein
MLTASSLNHCIAVKRIYFDEILGSATDLLSRLDAYGKRSPVATSPIFDIVFPIALQRRFRRINAQRP